MEMNYDAAEPRLLPIRAAATAVPSWRRRPRVNARAGLVFSRVRIWTVSKYGPAADALASDRRSVGEWAWATCRGGSVAAAAAIAVGEAARPWWVGWCVVGCRVVASLARGKLDYFS